MSKVLLQLFIISLFCTISNAQELKYNVSFMNSDIGFVQVTKELKNDSTIHYFNSETEFSFLFMSLKTKAITRLSYFNNILQTAYVLRTKNENTQELMYSWNGNSYNVIDNEKEYILKDEIYYCSASFFLEEPINVKKVFIERFNYFVDIESLGNHQYETKVDGGTNTYKYENGILQNVTSKKGFTVYMELVK